MTSYFSYIVSSLLFIFSLKCLSSPKTAFKGNVSGIIGMIIAILTTLIYASPSSIVNVVIVAALGGAVGFYISKKTKMTSLPQLVAAFHSLVGLCAVFISISASLNPKFSNNLASLIEMSLGCIIGAVTFSGSVVAFLKLQGSIKSSFSKQKYLNETIFLALIFLFIAFCSNGNHLLLLIISLLAMVLGVTIFIPVGGADMPVIVSLLNSYSGFAAVGIGFTLNNHLLIITGSIVGSSGAILSYVMCKGMNR